MSTIGIVVVAVICVGIVGAVIFGLYKLANSVNKNKTIERISEQAKKL